MFDVLFATTTLMMQRYKQQFKHDRACKWLIFLSTLNTNYKISADMLNQT